MEKISKVVPTSPKYDIDMSKERPMRSGMPNYGLPVSQSAATEKRLAETEELKHQSQIEKQALKENSKEVDHESEIVDQVTFSFKKINENPDQIEKKVSTLNPENSIDLEDVEELESPRLSLYA